jgi:hypothetical protein
MEWGVAAFHLPLEGTFSVDSLSGDGAWPPTLSDPPAPDEVGGVHISSVCMREQTESFIIIQVELPDAPNIN